MKPNFKLPISLPPLFIESQSLSLYLFLVFISASAIPDLRAVTRLFSLPLDEKQHLDHVHLRTSPVQCQWHPLCLELMDPVLAALNRWGHSEFSGALLVSTALGPGAAIPDHSFPAPFDRLPLVVAGWNEAVGNLTCACLFQTCPQLQ